MDMYFRDDGKENELAGFGPQPEVPDDAFVCHTSSQLKGSSAMETQLEANIADQRLPVRPKNVKIDDPSHESRVSAQMWRDVFKRLRNHPGNHDVSPRETKRLRSPEFIFESSPKVALFLDGRYIYQAMKGTGNILLYSHITDNPGVYRPAYYYNCYGQDNEATGEFVTNFIRSNPHIDVESPAFDMQTILRREEDVHEKIANCDTEESRKKALAEYQALTRKAGQIVFRQTVFPKMCVDMLRFLYSGQEANEVQAVIIVSNQKGLDRIVTELNENDVFAYVAITPRIVTPFSLMDKAHGYVDFDELFTFLNTLREKKKKTF